MFFRGIRGVLLMIKLIHCRTLGEIVTSSEHLKVFLPSPLTEWQYSIFLNKTRSLGGERICFADPVEENVLKARAKKEKQYTQTILEVVHGPLASSRAYYY